VGKRFIVHFGCGPAALCKSVSSASSVPPAPGVAVGLVVDLSRLAVDQRQNDFIPCLQEKSRAVASAAVKQ